MMLSFDEVSHDYPADSTVCETGSVVIDPWLRNAIYSQNTLARKHTVCYANWPGTHNSAITIVNGYGNSDYDITNLITPYFHKALVQTNDQYLSLTDQLRLGVRTVELDTHYVLGELRIAHCGGANFSDVNNAVKWINNFVHDLGINLTLYWDTETIGCNPSLSAIPADLQRSLANAFEEIAAWVFDASNTVRVRYCMLLFTGSCPFKDEFTMFFFDDQADLGTWDQVPALLSLIDQFFGPAVYTPVDYAANGGWPTVEDMVASGKHVLFMSGSDYGALMNSTVFYKYGPQLCDWTEPDVNAFAADFPTCMVDVDGVLQPTNTGRILRPETSEIVYGIFDGGSQKTGILNETTIPPLVACNVNYPSPDLLTPDRIAAWVWSWAPANPANYTSFCGAITSTDSLWRDVDCATTLPVVCLGSSLADLTLTTSSFTFAEAATACLAGGTFGVPTSAMDNRVLASLMSKSGVAQAWINAPVINV